MLLKVKQLQKELENTVIEVTKGDGAVKVEMSGEQKLKKIRLDPSKINLSDIEQLENWLEAAVRDAVSHSQKLAAEKMQPMMGSFGQLGL